MDVTRYVFTKHSGNESSEMASHSEVVSDSSSNTFTIVGVHEDHPDVNIYFSCLVYIGQVKSQPASAYYLICEFFASLPTYLESRAYM